VAVNSAHHSTARPPVRGLAGDTNRVGESGLFQEGDLRLIRPGNRGIIGQVLVVTFPLLLFVSFSITFILRCVGLLVTPTGSAVLGFSRKVISASYVLETEGIIGQLLVTNFPSSVDCLLFSTFTLGCLGLLFDAWAC
jgi:hypothetical protein